MRFLRRVNLDEYAEWFLLPGINFNSEQSLRDGALMMQQQPHVFRDAVKRYPLPDDAAAKYLSSRMVERHSYALIVVSPEGTPKRDAALDRDAKRLNELFTRPNVFNYRPEDVFLVTARTAKDIHTELRRLAVLTELNEASTLVLYYSGHGVGQALLCQDGTQVRSADLSKSLQDIRAQRKLAILDCCFAGSMVDPIVHAPTGPVSPESRARTDSTSLQMDLQSRGMAVLGSSNRSQTSAWFDGFSTFLISALEGAPVCPLTNSRICGANDQCSFFRTKACQIEQGHICIFDLFQFLKKHANEFLLEGQTFVHPYLKYEGDDNFRLCQFAGRPVEQEELDNFITRTMANDGDVDMQKYFLKKLNELGTAMDSNLRVAIDEGDARLEHTLLEAITNTTEQVKQSLLKAINEGDARVRDAAIAHVERAVENVVESQILTHAPSLVTDAVATVIRTTTAFLRNKYRQDTTIRLLPYVHDSAVDMDTIFTTLNIVLQEHVVRPPQLLESREDAISKYEDIYQVYQHASIDAVFCNPDAVVRRLLIQGRPGIGKSTLCRRIVREWAANTLWPGRFYAVFIIPLGSITEADAGLDIPHLIHKYCLEASPAINVSLLGQSLRQRAEKMLIILDGYDEFTNPKYSPTLTRFIHGMVPEYHQCRVILTSRLSSVNTLRQVLSENNSFDREFEIVGFNATAVRRFILSYFQAVGAPHMADKLIALLSETPVLQGIAHIPLHAALLCISWEEKKGVFPTTSTELVKQLVDDILERNTRRLAAFKGEPGKSAQPVLLRMLVCLGQLALHGFQGGALLFQASTVDEICKSRLPAELGFLHEDKVSSRRKGSRPVFYFLHLAFQEYLAAMFLVQSRTVLAQFNSDARYDMIWKFACGFLQANAGPLIDLIVQHALRDGNRRLVLLALDCLRESRHADALAPCLKPLCAQGLLDLGSTDLNATQLSQLLLLSEAFPALHTIRANGTKIGVTQPVAISAFQSLLGRNSSITSLSLAGCRLGDDGVQLLAGALMNNATLAELVLNDNLITVAGIALLASALDTNTSVKTLRFGMLTRPCIASHCCSLSRNPIGEVGIRALVPFLKRNTSLRTFRSAGRAASAPLTMPQVLWRAAQKESVCTGGCASIRPSAGSRQRPRGARVGMQAQHRTAHVSAVSRGAAWARRCRPSHQRWCRTDVSGRLF